MPSYIFASSHFLVFILLPTFFFSLYRPLPRLCLFSSPLSSSSISFFHFCLSLSFLHSPILFFVSSSSPFSFFSFSFLSFFTPFTSFYPFPSCGSSFASPILLFLLPPSLPPPAPPVSHFTPPFLSSLAALESEHHHQHDHQKDHRLGIAAITLPIRVCLRVEHCQDVCFKGPVPRSGHFASGASSTPLTKDA